MSENLATDMSGRPISRPTAGELLAEDVSQRPVYDRIEILPDGTEVVEVDGKDYPIKDGQPDWDNPVPRSEVEGR